MVVAVVIFNAHIQGSHLMATNALTLFMVMFHFVRSGKIVIARVSTLGKRESGSETEMAANKWLSDEIEMIQSEIN
jgi:hypothetical protein